MKTITLHFENGTILNIHAIPEEGEFSVNVQFEGSEIVLTNDINEARDIYESFPGTLVYYTQRIKE